jgi:hypothetical protein
MKPPSLSLHARRRIAIPSALTIAGLCLACPESPPPPPPACGAPQATPPSDCVDDAGCTHRIGYVVDDAGVGSLMPTVVECPANGVCDYGFFGDAEVVDACPGGGPCVNVTTADGGLPVEVVCRDQADANPSCYGETAYFADGATRGSAVGC